MQRYGPPRDVFRTEVVEVPKVGADAGAGMGHGCQYDLQQRLDGHRAACRCEGERVATTLRNRAFISVG